ncbi:MAG: AEC family transporter [Myxococcota bacterium]
METVSQLISILLPVYLCASIGYFWTRSGRSFDTDQATNLIMIIGGPCLVFSSLSDHDIDIDLMLEMFGATVLATGIMGILGAGLLRIWGLSVRTFVAPLSFGNTGNLGLPVCYFTFGPEGLALGVCFFAATSFLQFTVGQAIWSQELSLGRALRTPLVWATLAGLVTVGFDLSVPVWMTRTTTILGGFTIPLMQLALGVSIARLEVVRMGRSLGLSAIKLGLGAGVGFGVAALLGLEGAAAGVVVLNCAMPVAVFNYLFAERYGRSPNEVASVIVVSTLMSLLTLPLLIGFFFLPAAT